MMKGWFVRGDVDGFFGLFVDNLLQLMLMAVLCPVVCGLPTEMVTHRILPGAALSILVGNLFYAWQARRLAARTGRSDVTALPYGINTPSLLAYITLVMAPVYAETKDAHLAWQAGLFACLGSAVLECAGAFLGGWLRAHTPRAALLSSLAGLAVAFIAGGFLFQVFAMPLVALFPALVILLVYAGRVRLPLGLPGGLVAVVVGTALAWILRAFGVLEFHPPVAAAPLAWAFPRLALGDMLAFLADGRGVRFLAVIFPMGLFTVIGSLQNLESAEAAGDRFETRSSLLANGIGSLAAAAFGSPFPTTLYIGHPGWKAMGARSGYSIINGVAIALLCLVGGVTHVLQVVPIEAALGILLWIGIIMTAQAFGESPKAHGTAVAMGLLPALASWALVLIETSLRVAHSSLWQAAPHFGSDLYIYGVIALSQGFLLSSMILAAVMVFVIERRFLQAAGWTAAAAALSYLGLIHAFALTPRGVEARLGFGAGRDFALAYLAVAAMLLGLAAVRSRRSAEH